MLMRCLRSLLVLRRFKGRELNLDRGGSPFCLGGHDRDDWHENGSDGFLCLQVAESSCTWRGLNDI